MEKDNNIYETAANWWADIIRENTANKISEDKLNIFKSNLASLIENLFKLNGYVNILMKPNNILAISMFESNIFVNDFLFTIKDEIKLTPHMITIYDQYGNLKNFLSI